MGPPAPGLLSTMMVWPSSACSGIATRRATMSEEPPGAKVTMTRTGFVGHAWAAASSDPSRATTRIHFNFISTPSVGRIAPGGTQERDVVVRSRVGDREPDRHGVEKALRAEIRTDVEHELIGTAAQLFSLQERRIGAAVPVRRRFRKKGTGVPVHAVDLDCNARAGLSLGGVEHVGSELTHRACLPGGRG